MTPERQQVQEIATRLLASQCVRWRLDCEPVAWAQAATEIAALRERVYAEKLPHMLGDGGTTDANDERAHHFVARREGTTIAAMRLLPAPFESESLFPQIDQYLRLNTRYIEIGRMVVAPDAGEVGASRLLSLYGLVWGLTNTQYDGLIAYARARTINHFQLLGLTVAAQRDSVPGKAEQPYVLMVGHLEDTLNNLQTLI